MSVGFRWHSRCIEVCLWRKVEGVVRSECEECSDKAIEPWGYAGTLRTHATVSEVGCEVGRDEE